MKYKYTDYHLHTTPWSVDVGEDGPKFEDYIKIAEINEINICFLEHYELYYIEKDRKNPFYNGNIENYLEEIDELKETYDFIYSGLEVEYYKDREMELLEFIDDYERELDFIGGTLHEWIFGYPVTSKKKLLELLDKKKMKDVINEYFETSEKMIKSKIFKNICHLDVIFRYINENDIIPEENCDISEERVLELGRLCIENNLSIEYNLSGIKYPIGRPFPSKAIISRLKKEGGKFFIGSDSHSLEYFENQISKVIEAYEYLRPN